MAPTIKIVMAASSDADAGIGLNVRGKDRGMTWNTLFSLSETDTQSSRAESSGLR